VPFRAVVRASAPPVATSEPHENEPLPEIQHRKSLARNWMRSAPGTAPRPSHAVNQSEHQFAPEKVAPRRGLERVPQAVRMGEPAPEPVRGPIGTVHCEESLGGLLKSYRRAA